MSYKHKLTDSQLNVLFSCDENGILQYYPVDDIRLLFKIKYVKFSTDKELILTDLGQQMLDEYLENPPVVVGYQRLLDIKHKFHYLYKHIKIYHETT